jgi:hypothetical protein
MAMQCLLAQLRKKISLDLFFMHTTPKFVRSQHAFMAGLTFSLKPKHSSLFRPTDKTSFVCKLAIVKYFDRLKLCDEVWLEM